MDPSSSSSHDLAESEEQMIEEQMIEEQMQTLVQQQQHQQQQQQQYQQQHQQHQQQYQLPPTQQHQQQYQQQPIQELPQQQYLQQYQYQQQPMQKLPQQRYQPQYQYQQQPLQELPQQQYQPQQQQQLQQQLQQIQHVQSPSSAPTAAAASMMPSSSLMQPISTSSTAVSTNNISNNVVVPPAEPGSADEALDILCGVVTVVVDKKEAQRPLQMYGSTQKIDEIPKALKSCHCCGNVRKKRVSCSRTRCAQVFCSKCYAKHVEEFGPDAFALGCPVCRELCCCSNRSTTCNRAIHCYRKCPAQIAIYKAQNPGLSLVAKNPTPDVEMVQAPPELQNLYQQQQQQQLKGRDQLPPQMTHATGILATGIPPNASLASATYPVQQPLPPPRLSSYYLHQSPIQQQFQAQRQLQDQQEQLQHQMQYR